MPDNHREQPRMDSGGRMREDTRNHWKMDNLGKVSPLSGIRRIAADPHYKGEAVIGADG